MESDTDDDEFIDVNDASIEELQQLHGVTPSMVTLQRAVRELTVCTGPGNRGVARIESFHVRRRDH